MSSEIVETERARRGGRGSAISPHRARLPAGGDPGMPGRRARRRPDRLREPSRRGADRVLPGGSVGHARRAAARRVTSARAGRRQQRGNRLPSTAKGRAIPVEVHVGAIEGPERFLVVTLRDMTELQAGREARFEAEAKYRTLVEQIPAVVYLDPVDENKDSIYVSPQITDLLGIEPADWLEDPYCWRSHVHDGRHRPRLGGVRGRLPDARAPEPRVPDAARGRHDQVGDGAGVPDRRRRRRTVADPGRDLRHHAAQARRGADRVPGLPRQVDRPAEPCVVRGDARERAGPCPSLRPRRRRARSWTSTTSSS